MKAIDNKELILALEELEKEDLKYQVGINLALYTGMRRRRNNRFEMERYRLEK